ncbi:hypothetical protein [Streptomyces carpaticus]|uniref:Uncharacterized protein n=1 Tax=Streptomyces carpaticus TaxID=285558 RepID=A0ABV4ZJ28_9ACTN
MAQIDRLMSHRSQHMAGHGFVPRLRSEAYGDSEIALCYRVFSVVEGHPTAYIGQLTRRREQTTSNPVVGESPAKTAGHVTGEVLDHRTASVPATVALIDAREQLHHVAYRIQVAVTEATGCRSPVHRGVGSLRPPVAIRHGER